MSIQVQHRRDTNANIESVTPAVGELGYDTTKKEALIGDGATAGGVRLQKKNTREILIPAQITANQNDYNPSGLKHAAALRLSSDASRNITGIVPVGAVDTTDGRALVVYNAGSFNVVLQDQNASSSAANRFDLGGADITLAPKQSLSLRYSNTISRWEVADNNFGQAISDGSVSARKLAVSAFGMSMINGTLVPSVAGSALTVAIKTLAGNDPSTTDPVYVLVRDATAAAGDFSVMTLTAATSLVVSSGSSLGVAANNTAFKIWIAGFNDAGTFRLAAINCLSGQDIFALGGFGIASSTSEGGAGAADNAQTFYTGTAVASKPFATLGYLSWESGLAAAGTWSAGPTRSQLLAPGVPLPGQIVQRCRSSSGAVATGTTIIPFDDTIPQNTEGDQYLSKGMTPSSAAHLLRVETELRVSPSTSLAITGALFQDSGANALASAISYNGQAGGMSAVHLDYIAQAATLSLTTFKVRAGPQVAGTITVNGQSGTRVHAGISNSYVEIQEIAT